MLLLLKITNYLVIKYVTLDTKITTEKISYLRLVEVEIKSFKKRGIRYERNLL